MKSTRIVAYKCVSTLNLSRKKRTLLVFNSKGKEMLFLELSFNNVRDSKSLSTNAFVYLSSSTTKISILFI